MTPIHVDITNVAHWLYVENSREKYDLDKDFVSLISPWEMAVFEWQMPRFINSEGRVIDTGVNSVRYKVGCLQDEIKDDYDRRRRIGQFKREVRLLNRHPQSCEDWMPLDELVKDECRHVGTYDIFLTSGLQDAFLSRVMLHLDTGGHLMGMPYVIAAGSASDAPAFPSIIYPVLFAFSFMACKNVELVDKPLTRQQRRKIERKGGIQYKVLTIHPMNTQTRYERTNQANGSHKALHICRGHFATYSEDKPLFGKHSGTFWRPMHTRGSKAHGEVVKDYKVEL